MAAGTNVGNADGEIIYKISAGKDYRSDVGRLYTKSYSVLDVIAFDGFALDISGYGLSVDASVKKGELYLTKDGRNVAKLIGLDVYKRQIISCTLLILICAPAAYVLSRFKFISNKVIPVSYTHLPRALDVKI